jgi:hypothetical protein
MHKRMQKSRRVGTARDGHQHPFAASQQRLVANGMQNLGQHRKRIHRNPATASRSLGWIKIQLSAHQGIR